MKVAAVMTSPEIVDSATNRSCQALSIPGTSPPKTAQTPISISEENKSTMGCAATASPNVGLLLISISLRYLVEIIFLVLTDIHKVINQSGELARFTVSNCDVFLLHDRVTDKIEFKQFIGQISS